jgi:hypothetical protein
VTQVVTAPTGAGWRWSAFTREDLHKLALAGARMCPFNPQVVGSSPTPVILQSPGTQLSTSKACSLSLQRAALAVLALSSAPWFQGFCNG